MHATYVSRVLRMTLLAPDIVEAILDGRQPAEMQLDNLLEGFPLDWQDQRDFGDPRPAPAAGGGRLQEGGGTVS